jgi:predicted regulator of amino acid metabolism with ACT domain
MFLERKEKTVYKRSINNKDLIFSNFLPIKNISKFDEMVGYLQTHINNGNARDITTLRQEKNGTLILQIFKPEVYLSLYTNKKGYVRYNTEGINRIVNYGIKFNEETQLFCEDVEPITSIEEQLHLICRYIIFNKE